MKKRNCQRGLKITLLVLGLFLVNVVVMVTLQKLGFAVTMNSNSYIVPPLLSAGVLVWLVEKIEKDNTSSFEKV